MEHKLCKVRYACSSLIFKLKESYIKYCHNKSIVSQGSLMPKIWSIFYESYFRRKTSTVRAPRFQCPNGLWAENKKPITTTKVTTLLVRAVKNERWIRFNSSIADMLKIYVMFRTAICNTLKPLNVITFKLQRPIY